MEHCQDVKIVSGDCSDAFQLMQFTGRADTVQVDLYYEPTALSPLFDGAGEASLNQRHQYSQIQKGRQLDTQEVSWAARQVHY